MAGLRNPFFITIVINKVTLYILSGENCPLDKRRGFCYSKIMKKLFFLTTFIFAFHLFFPSFSLAQDNHTASEEAKGKGVWEKLQTKDLNCEDLIEDDFGALGEYFMGQMMGDSHEAMNEMMIKMMGQEDEEQMHIAMGKRMSGCKPNALMPENIMGGNLMPMMQMMMGNMMKGGDNSMMGPGSNFAGMMGNAWGSSWFFGIHSFLALITWLALIAFLISAARYFWRKS